MSIKSEFEKPIEAYIDNNPSCDIGRTQRIEVEGKIQDLPVYRLPIRFLAFNVENGRFAADLYTLEKSLKKKLDARNPDDADKIMDILLKKNPNDTKGLEEDLVKRGQVEPGVITAAGMLVNANRRMAALIDLHRKTSDDRYIYLEVSKLPSNISELEIYKIEARLQYAKDFKIGFGAVNELLKIREGISKGMEQKELAALLHRDEKYIQEQLDILTLLEAYSKFAWNEIDFKKIEEEKITEAITDVEKNQRKFKSWGLDASKLSDLLKVQFEYINSGSTYQDIRKFGKYVPDQILDVTDAYLRLQLNKISKENYKQRLDDISVKGKIKTMENFPLELLNSSLEKLRKFQDGQYEITSEMNKSLLDIYNITTELIKKSQ